MTAPLPSDDEQRLLRLLALKRYETPPPGFFDHLPRRILVSVRAGVELEDASWWERLRHLILREPMVAGSYAALGLGAVLFGVSVFETARGTGDLAPVDFHGSFAGTADLVTPGPASLPSGVIYRIVPSTPTPGWLTSDGLPAPRLERFEPLERFDTPGETRPAAVLVNFR